MSVKRFDSSALGKAEPTPQGGVKVPAFLTRVGVFTYRMTDGTIRKEFRPQEEVFSTDSLLSLQHAPVTVLHPSEPVTADNWRTVAVGHVAPDVHPEGTHVAASVLVQDSPTVNKIDRGELKEVSCGYTCDTDETPGSYLGERFDAVQRKIRYNHVALGPNGWGRAGSSVSLRLDSGDAIQLEEEGSKMIKIRIDGVDYEAGSEAHLQAAAAQVKRLEEATAKEKSRADAAEGELSAIKPKLAKAESDLAAKIKAENDAKTKARKDSLLATCRKVSAKLGVRFDEAAAVAADEGSILASLVMMMDPSANLEGKSADFIGGLATGMISKLLTDEATEETVSEDAPASPPPVDGAAPTVGDSIFEARKAAATTKRKDSADRLDAEASRLKMLEHNRTAWTRPLAMSKAQ